MSPPAFVEELTTICRRLWMACGLVVVLSFAVLGWTGVRIYQEAPPIPDRAVTTDGRQVIRAGEISEGQNVWQSIGGMEVGSVWGHGSYVAHYSDVFSRGREEYAIPAGALTDAENLRKMSAFFFWTSWAASTNRPRRHHRHKQLAARTADREPAHG